MDITRRASDHRQLRALYQSLLSRHDRFEEFRRLLALYHVDSAQAEQEPEAAAEVRRTLNERIREWVGCFDGLTASQTLLWRAILVEERFNVAISEQSDFN